MRHAFAVLVLIQTQPTDRTRQKNPHSQKAVDKGRGYMSKPFQIEPYGVETSESDRSEMRTTQWEIFWESL
jgi:hypothetical protein